MSRRRTYGTGTIYTRGRSWYARWYDSAGERHNGVVGPMAELTKKQAEAKLRDMIAATPKPSAPDGPTLAKVMADWTRHLEDVGAAPTYLEDAQSALKHHVLPFFRADVLVTSIDRDRCKAFRVHLGDLTSKRTGKQLSAKTIKNYVAVLSALLSYALAEGMIAANPALGLPTPRRTDDGVIDIDEVIWPEDVERLVAAVAPGAYNALDRALYRTATMAGARKGECLGMRWCDVDLGARRLRIFEQLARGDRRRAPKSGRGRSVPMDDAVRDALLELRNVSQWTAPDEPVFADPYTGQRVAWTPARKRYLAALKAAGLDRFTRFHDLRHTFASALARGGVPERQIMEWCGHSSPGVTRRYMHFAPSTEADLAAVAAAFAPRPVPAQIAVAS